METLTAEGANSIAGFVSKLATAKAGAGREVEVQVPVQEPTLSISKKEGI